MDNELRATFGAEWDALDHQSRTLVIRDFIEAANEEDIDASEYHRRIGRGNLRSYADVMVVRERQGWNK